jgi:hypothetical protein
VFTSEVYPDCPAIRFDDFATGDTCNIDRDEALDKSKVKAQIFTHLLYRHWNHFTGDKRSHLMQVTLDVPPDTPYWVRDLTPNDPHDVRRTRRSWRLRRISIRSRQSRLAPASSCST